MEGKNTAETTNTGSLHACSRFGWLRSDTHRTGATKSSVERKKVGDLINGTVLGTKFVVWCMGPGGGGGVSSFRPFRTLLHMELDDKSEDMKCGKGFPFPKKG